MACRFCNANAPGGLLDRSFEIPEKARSEQPSLFYLCLQLLGSMLAYIIQLFSSAGRTTQQSRSPRLVNGCVPVSTFDESKTYQTIPAQGNHRPKPVSYILSGLFPRASQPLVPSTIQTRPTEGGGWRLYTNEAVDAQSSRSFNSGSRGSITDEYSIDLESCPFEVPPSYQPLGYPSPPYFSC